MPYCAAEGCNNNHRSGLKLHRFPRDAARSQVWADICCVPEFKPSDCSVLCEEHFAADQYELNRNDGRKLLKWNSIPFKKRQTDCFSVLPLQKRIKISPVLDAYACEDFQLNETHISSVKPTGSEKIRQQPTVTTNQPVKRATLSTGSALSSSSCDARPQPQPLPSVPAFSQAAQRQHVTILSVLNTATSTECTSLHQNPDNQLAGEMNSARDVCRQKPAALVSNSSSQTPAALMSDASNQTSAALTSSSPRKVALRRRLAAQRVTNSRLKSQRKKWRERCRQLKKTLKVQKSVGSCNLRNIVSATEKLLSEEGQALFVTQVKLASCHKKGRRYSNELKNLALSLHYKGAKAYRFLSSILTLPSKSSLHMWMHNLNIQPGLSIDVWDVLKLRVESLSPRDRVCALLLDEMSLKVNLSYSRNDDLVVGFEDVGGGRRSSNLANSALVLMVRGLAYSWKQPLGYIFTSSAAKSDVVKSLLFECIDRLKAIGLHVVTVISDQGPNFQQLVRNLGISIDKPFFEHNGCKYCFMFDPPHLLKSIRNNLHNYSFVFDGDKTACWADIETFFKLDQQQRFRLAPRLTPKHINLPAFSKMKVKLAAQVLSRSVASGLETHAMLKFGTGSDTAEFITVFDDLFDALNSSQRTSVKKFKCALTNNSEHLLMFERRLDWLKSLKAVDNNGKDVTCLVKCIAGWQLTLSAVVTLWHDLNSNYNFDFLLTRRLNQDCLENFFSVIRQRGGSCVNPTPLSFSRLFRQVCCNTLFKPVIGSNCEIDCAAVLASLNSNSKRSVQMTSNPAVLCGEDKRVDNMMIDLALTCTDENELEHNGVSYVAGFLLRRLLKWHSCSVCESLWISEPNLLDDDRNIYIKCRLYKSDELKGGKGLVFVSQEFFHYIQQLEETFDACYQQHCHIMGISTLIVSQLVQYPLPVVCSKFPKLQFLRYFVRVRIYYKLKFANASEKTSSSTCKNRKLLNLKHK